jgi:hypothetical protein
MKMLIQGILIRCYYFACALTGAWLVRGGLDPRPTTFLSVIIGAAIGWYVLKALRWWRVPGNLGQRRHEPRIVAGCHGADRPPPRRAS